MIDTDKMLLVVDVGNTNTVVGVFDGADKLVHSWRIRSDASRTDDEYAMLLSRLLEYRHLRLEQIGAVVVSCVVPPMLDALQWMCDKYLGLSALVVGRNLAAPMDIEYDNPAEVGADRIVNAVAAYDKYRRAMIVVDFGTATTFDYINATGAYCGGAIAPGLGISADALHRRASKLPRVELVAPPLVVAKNTVHSMQSGLLYGYAGLVDGIVARMKDEVGGAPLVVATGGLAVQIAAATASIDEVEPLLTLNGLLLLYRQQPQDAVH